MYATKTILIGQQEKSTKFRIFNNFAG